MIRKVKKSELDRLQRGGARVNYKEPTPKSVAPPPPPSAVVMEVPKDVKDLLRDAITAAAQVPQQTQMMVAQILEGLVNTGDLDVQVTARDENGNISQLKFTRPTRH